MHDKQRYFSYASVASCSEEAMHSVSRIIRDYRIQGGELKGKNLLKFNKGRHAVDEVFEEYRDRTKISISDKKYALAGKFFEYIFEPAIAEISSAFYGINFHLFIANILYSEFQNRAAGAEEIFREFETLMRDLDEDKLDSLFAPSAGTGSSTILSHIKDFALSQRHHVQGELSTLRDGSTGKWILDLTGSSLAIQLSHWGLKYDEMIVVCDESKPLAEAPAFFDAMVGKKDRTLFVDTPLGSQPFTFNLAEPIRFRDSKIEQGIQIADVMAAGAAYAISNPHDKFGGKWLEILQEIGEHGSILPDSDHINLNEPGTRFNALVLARLHYCASNGMDLVTGISPLLHAGASDIHSLNTFGIMGLHR